MINFKIKEGEEELVHIFINKEDIGRVTIEKLIPDDVPQITVPTEDGTSEVIDIPNEKPLPKREMRIMMKYKIKDVRQTPRTGKRDGKTVYVRDKKGKVIIDEIEIEDYAVFHIANEDAIEDIIKQLEE